MRQFYASGPTEPRHISIYYNRLFHLRPISGRIFPRAFFFFFAWEYASVMLWTEAYSCLCLGFESTEAVKLVRFINPKSQPCSNVFNIRKTYAGSVDPKSRHHYFAPPPHRLAIKLVVLVAPLLPAWISPLFTYFFRFWFNSLYHFYVFCFLCCWVFIVEFVMIYDRKWVNGDGDSERFA